MKFFAPLLIAFSLITVSANRAFAQAGWEAPLGTQLEALAAGTSPEILARVGPATERIAAANPEAWLPNYYAAHFALLQYWTSGEAGCEGCLDRADSYLGVAEAADNNSEVMTLRATYYQALLRESPIKSPYYGPKATNLLEAAVKAEPSNPRASATLGSNLYYTPSMFGGGPDAARPHLERAIELFTEEADADRELLPTWGAERAQTLLAEATASN